MSSEEEIIKKATEELKKKGMPNYLQAKYINYSSKVAAELRNSNPRFRLLAPKIKAPETVPWGCAYVLLHNLLAKWKMDLTLDCILQEKQGFHIPEVEDFIEPGEEESYLMHECIEAHGKIPFKTRIFDFKTEQIARFNEEEEDINDFGNNEEDVSSPYFDTSKDQSGLLPRTNELSFTDSESIRENFFIRSETHFLSGKY